MADGAKHMKAGIMVSSGLALASLGDSFLYVYLPASHAGLGLSAFWVGVLLSVNRFSRLFFNGWVAFRISRHGIKTATIVALAVALVSTLAYGFAGTVFTWLLLRIAWGLSFSTLRLSSLVYAVQHPQKGFSIGISKSIIAMGPVIALTVGPLLLAELGRPATFSALAGIGMCALFFSFRLPAIDLEPPARKDLYLSFPSPFNILVLLCAMAEAAVIVLAGRILSPEHDHISDLLIVVGAFLAYKRICLVLFSPLAGWLADKIGFEKLFNYTTAAMIAGLIFLTFGYGATGLVIVFTFSAMSASIAPGGALKNNRSMLKEFSDNATWRDIGTAAGTLGGALFLDYHDLLPVLASFGVVLSAGLVLHIYTIHKQKSVQWK